MAEIYNISEYMKENPAGPIGTIKFIPYATKLFDKTEPNPILLCVSSGRHMFWIERDNDFNLNYYHSSPGTDTRVASVDLNSIVVSDTIFIIFSWSPDEIILNVGTSKKDGKVVSSKGKSSLVKFRVGEDSLIYRMGEENGITHIFTDYYSNGKYILQSTALEAWTETIKAINILATGESTEGYSYEKVVSNLTLSVLVTGFESYTKKRFLELEQEGISPRIDMIIKEFYTKSERDNNIPDAASKEADEEGITELRHIIINQNRINFRILNIVCVPTIKGIKLGFLN